jgi:uncharacterized membrane protein YphA (DoxX/SURF4 family)
MKPMLNRIVGIACLVLAIYFLYQVSQGLISGEVAKLSKYGQEIIRKDAQPDRFWIAIVFWSIGAGILVVTGIKKLFRSN